ncbi:MAG: GNAT family N-acetyltransferase [Chloroflexi bacterium]|nr:GNAT family N-acetyltransferase [Chloroflexota bacterium]
MPRTPSPPFRAIIRAMDHLRIRGLRLDLTPLPAAVAAALPGDRGAAERLLGATLPDAWPQADLLDVLPIQAAAEPEGERFGIWLMIERERNTVVGDIGFLGPPNRGRVEIGFSVIPDRRRRGYATEAAVALADWVVGEPDVHELVARSEVANEASARTLAGAGFIREDEHEGLVSWRRARACRGRA